MRPGSGLAGMGIAVPDRRWRGAAAVLAMAMVLVGTASTRADMYKWVDESGREHYSNVPSEIESEDAARSVIVEESPVGRAPRRAAPVGSDDSEGDGLGASTSSERFLERSALEREYRETKARLAEIDRELKSLAEARLRFATEGHASVGGVAAVGAANVRSPAEEALEEEREELTKALEGIQAKLRSTAP